MKKKIISLILVLAISLSFSATSFAKTAYFEVVANKLRVRTGPGTDYDTITILRKGDTVDRYSTETIKADGYLWVIVYSAEDWMGYAAYKNLSSGTYYLDVIED
ncbi:SH3 domain-containing protein [Vallitalea guaymasensis]|uniref:SH3 domain-containing protein n=1 Tax=Vallitalea guaymasensis TaxID=1185412 RepID=UPI000DE43D20|nr:SH3 domain-containing protein [Vallitalea guaymasensis]